MKNNNPTTGFNYIRIKIFTYEYLYTNQRLTYRIVAISGVIFMIDYETIARDNHHNGMNCSKAVYSALSLAHNANTSKPPFPRSEGGKCGAVLAAEQFIRENGTEKDVEEFDRRFIEKYGHLTCFKLRGLLGGKCNDYVGTAAAIVANMGITGDGE